MCTILFLCLTFGFVFSQNKELEQSNVLYRALLNFCPVKLVRIFSSSLNKFKVELKHFAFCSERELFLVGTNRSIFFPVNDLSITNFKENEKYLKQQGNLHDGHIFYVHMFICSNVHMPTCVSHILISLHKSVSFMEHQHFVRLDYGNSMPVMQARQTSLFLPPLDYSRK